MKSKKEMDNLKNLLISKLIHSFMGVIETDSYFRGAFDYTKNYLENNSLMYSYKTSEIETKINSLVE
jgi:hypothetical protein